MRSQAYDVVDALAAVLRDRALTAAAITELFNCSKPVAYKRLRELEGRGVELHEERVREGRSGPLSIAYSIAGRKRVAPVLAEHLADRTRAPYSLSKRLPHGKRR